MPVYVCMIHNRSGLPLICLATLRLPASRLAVALVDSKQARKEGLHLLPEAFGIVVRRGISSIGFQKTCRNVSNAQSVFFSPTPELRQIFSNLKKN